jgi:hypothetical protein
MLQSTIINAFVSQSGQTYQVINNDDPLFINIRPRPFPNSNTIAQSHVALNKMKTLYGAIDSVIKSVIADQNFQRYFDTNKNIDPGSYPYTKQKTIIIKENNSYASENNLDFFYNMISDNTILQRFYTNNNPVTYCSNPPQINGLHTVTKTTVDLIVPNNNTSSQSNPNIYSTISNYGINFNAMQYYKPDANLYECEKMFATYAGGIVPMAYCLNYINNNATPQELETSGILTMFPKLF